MPVRPDHRHAGRRGRRGGARCSARRRRRCGRRDAGSGCSSSLRAALPRVDPLATGIVLLLGDQPGVSAVTVERLIAEGRDSPIAVCRYSDGVGHPFSFHRSAFGELDQLHGDKGIWKLIESGRVPVRELAVEGTVPPDVDTWDDYRRLLASAAQ